MQWWLLCDQAQKADALHRRLRLSDELITLAIPDECRRKRHSNAWAQLLESNEPRVAIVDADVSCGFSVPAKRRMPEALQTMTLTGRSCMFLGARNPYECVKPTVGPCVGELPLSYNLADYAVGYVLTREGAAMLLREVDKWCHFNVHTFIQSTLAYQACMLAIPLTFATDR